MTTFDLRHADPAAAAPSRNRDEDGRRKVLLISYTFPPQYDVSARRATKLCKYLPAVGWQPVVLTKDWQRDVAPEDRRAFAITSHPAGLDDIRGVEVVRAPYRSRDNALRRLHERLGGVYPRSAGTQARGTRARWTASAITRRTLSLFSPLFGDFPDAFCGWVPLAVRAGVQLVRRERIDVICSLCPPASAHVVASEIARRTGVPWVAQFDDLFSFHLERQVHAAWRPYTDRRHRRWMREAALAGAITPAMLGYVRRTYGLDGDVVMVGFDPDDRPVMSPRRGARMRLAYTGSIYPGDQRPDLLFEALERLHADGVNPPIEVVFAGTGRDTELRTMLERFPHAARVCEFIERVAPEDALRLQCEADALVLFHYTSPSPDEGTLSFPAKAFEYLNAGRPVIALPRDPGGWGDALLGTTRAGVTADSAAAAAAVLNEWLALWRGQGTLPYSADTGEIMRYSVARQAETLASLFERAVRRTAR